MSCLICVWDLLWFGFWVTELIIRTHQSDSRLNHLNWFCEQNQFVQWKEKKEDTFMVFYILFEVWKPHSLQLHRKQQSTTTKTCTFCKMVLLCSMGKKRFGKTWGWVNKSRIFSLIWNMAHFLLRWWPDFQFLSKQLKKKTH